MPQMAPMSWILLFMFFSFMLITINILNYYVFTPKIQSLIMNKNIKIKKNNWLW